MNNSTNKECYNKHYYQCTSYYQTIHLLIHDYLWTKYYNFYNWNDKHPSAGVHGVVWREDGLQICNEGGVTEAFADIFLQFGWSGFGTVSHDASKDGKV